MAFISLSSHDCKLLVRMRRLRGCTERAFKNNWNIILKKRDREGRRRHYQKAVIDEEGVTYLQAPRVAERMRRPDNCLPLAAIPILMRQLAPKPMSWTWLPSTWVADVAATSECPRAARRAESGCARHPAPSRSPRWRR